MSWKDKKEIESRKIVSLGGKVRTQLSICHMHSVGSIYYGILNEGNFEVSTIAFRPSILFYHLAASKEAKTAFKCSTTNHEKAEGKRTKDGTRGKEIH